MPKSMQKPQKAVFEIKKVRDFKNKQSFGFRNAFAAFAVLAMVVSLVSNTNIVKAVGASGDLEQSFNGQASSPVSPVTWGNGDANSNNSHFTEGQSMPYRVVLTGLTNGNTYSFNIDFKITKGGKHAIDFLTRPERIAETVNPCSGIVACSFSGGLDIPTPPTSVPNTRNYFNSLETAEGNQQFYLYNASGVISSYIEAGDENATGDSTATVSVSVVANSSTAVVAWGGHIGNEFDWGLGNGATGINGSPYHTSFGSTDSVSGGNQDQKLTAGAVTIGNLKVVKHVINNNSGNATASDFTLNVTGTDPTPLSFAGSESGTIVKLGAGTYSVTELSHTGYTQVSLDSHCSGTMVLGQLVTCTITNDDNAPTTASLTLVKTVTNNNGGQAVPTAWTLSASGPTSISGATGATAVTSATVNPGTYTLSESGGPSGYTASDWSCVKNNGSPVSGASISLVAGDTATCSINNDDQQAHLTVIKQVINDNGGTATSSDFTMSISNGTNVSQTSFPGSVAGTPVTLDAGNYSVGEEVGPSGYSPSFAGGCSGPIGPGENRTCTVTNNDIQPTLTVVKLVDNTLGGTATSGEFTLHVVDNATSSIIGDFPGSETGTLLQVNAGVYTVTESGPGNYTPSFVNCTLQGAVTVGIGENKTCTITNIYTKPPVKPGHLTIIKHVVNDNGGTATSSDFTISITGNNVSTTTIAGMDDPGTTVTMEPGNYSVTETPVTGYVSSPDSGCSGTMPEDGNVICTITNSSIAPTFTLTKIVNNTEGGTATSGDFTLMVTSNSASTTVVSGASNNFVAGDYTISEQGPTGYTASFEGNCDSQGGVTMGIGQAYSCTMTNTYSAQSADVKVEKIQDDQDAVYERGQTLTYTVTVTNNGPDLAKSVVVNDLLPAGVTLVSTSTTAGVYDETSGSWTVGNMASNASSTLTVVVTVNQDAVGTITNTATATSGVLDPNPNNNSSTVTGDVNVPTLTLTKTGDGNGVVTGSVDEASSTNFCELSECRESDEVKSFVHTYASGTVITLTAVPASDSNFNGTWTSGPCSGSNDPVCTFVMTGPVSVNAHFGLNQTGGGGCTSNCGGSTSGGGGIVINNPTPPAGQILGTSTVPSITMPEPQILGASTTLPRTGMPVGGLLAALAALVVLLNRKLKLV